MHGMTDWHCHILPGVDDGFKRLEDSLAALGRYELLGLSEVWLTPHVMEDIPNSTDGLRERFAELQAAYKGKVELNLASENMLDRLFEERLQKDDLLPWGKDGKHLLVETSYFNPPIGLNNILLRIKAKGYYPVLAHPERYLYMDMAAYQRLKSLDVKFQLNLFSLTGLYGKDAQKKAKALCKARMYDYAGTDLHRWDVLKSRLEKRDSVNSCRLLCE